MTHSSRYLGEYVVMQEHFYGSIDALVERIVGTMKRRGYWVARAIRIKRKGAQAEDITTQLKEL